MAAFWILSAEPRGLAVTVEATLERNGEDGWRGEVTTVPFDTLEARGPGFGAVRDRLAAAVLAETATGMMPVPARAITVIRMMATSVTWYYPCGNGNGNDGPLINVPAVADRDAACWCIATAGAAGPLGGMAATGPTVPAAQDALAEVLALALDVGIDGIPANCGGFRLLTLTRKSYSTRLLTAS